MLCLAAHTGRRWSEYAILRLQQLIPVSTDKSPYLYALQVKFPFTKTNAAGERASHKFTLFPDQRDMTTDALVAVCELLVVMEEDIHAFMETHPDMDPNIFGPDGAGSVCAMGRYLKHDACIDAIRQMIEHAGLEAKGRVSTTA